MSQPKRTHQPPPILYAEDQEDLRTDICDINMPGLNGYDVLEAVRERRPHLADTPFIFLTALSEPRDVADG